MSFDSGQMSNERLAGATGLALMAVTAALAIWLAQPSRSLPADAAADRFAAGRAMRDVRQLSGRPRPVGSAGHEAARGYLLGRMAELGLDPEVHEATVAQRRRGAIVAARVRNLVGRLRGRGAGGATLLVAHYDSRPNTPGAGDDASGVAVVLETVRALSAGPSLDGDVLVLLADAEELGLLGARGFAAEHPWMEEVNRVFNVEARGSGGPAAMFETGRGDLGLVRAFARSAPHPLASSLSAVVYERMPNDTDFSAFRAAGKSGLNFAFLGGLNAYHTALDTAERLDPASLQHAGANLVALIRHLDGVEAPARGQQPFQIAPRLTSGGIWFNPLGGWLLVLPAGAALPVAGALAALALGLAVLGLRRLRVGGRTVWAGGVACLMALMVAPLAGWGLWRLFADNAAGLLDTPYGLPHRLGLTGGALLLAGLAAVAVVAGTNRRLRPLESALGLALVWAFLGLLAAVVLPGASFLFWWPLWGLLVAAAVVLTVQAPRPWEVLFLSAGALPGIALLAPLAVLVFQALTPHLAAAAMALPALALTLALPALRALAAGRQGLSLGAAVASLALLVAAVWGAPDAQRPRSVDLIHLEEQDQGAGFWLSRDERLQPWVVERLGGEPLSWEAPRFLGLPERPISKGEVVALAERGAVATRVEDLRLDGRRLTVRLASPDGAPMLRVEAASTVQISSVELAGQRFERDGEESTAPLRLELAGLPPEGLEVSFQLPDRWPVELHLTEQFYGLPEAPALPPELIPTSSWLSHSRLVHRSYLH